MMFMLASAVDLGIAPALLAIPSVSAQDGFVIGVNAALPTRPT